MLSDHVDSVFGFRVRREVGGGWQGCGGGMSGGIGVSIIISDINNAIIGKDIVS
jgi:hypothetical protein